MLVPAMLVGAYLNLMVSNITSGVFGGMGKPFLATLLSFGLELPLSIGGVAVYILVFHGNLLGVYWWQAISGGIEIIIVFAILLRANWNQCAVEAKLRQEATSEHIGTEDDVDCDENHVPLLNDDADEEAACTDPD
jgi:MATE family multidrug resistance protein